MTTATLRESTAAHPDWIPNLLSQVSDAFELAEPASIVRWAIETFGDGLTLGTAFGVSGIVLMDLAIRVRPDVEIFYIDTGMFFEETYALIEQLEAHWGRTFTAYRPTISLERQTEEYGDELWASNPDQCCLMRKVMPMRRALTARTAWLTAVRRDQASTRADTPILQLNRKFNVVKIAPLANWTERQVWTWLMEQGLPYNVLHDHGYPSIGCRPCTSPVEGGDDLRAGRWAGTGKTECGLHL